MVWHQNLRSRMSSALSFQFFPGPSMRSMTLAPLFLRQMQEEPDDGCGVDEQVVLEVDSATVAVLPDVLRVAAGQRALTGVVANYSDRLSTTTWETLATERPEPTM